MHVCSILSPPLHHKGKATKQYLAVCHGDPGFDSVIDAPLYRRSSGKMGAVNPWEAADFKAKEAKTRVRNVATAAGECRVRAGKLKHDSSKFAGRVVLVFFA